MLYSVSSTQYTVYNIHYSIFCIMYYANFYPVFNIRYPVHNIGSSAEAPAIIIPHPPVQLQACLAQWQPQPTLV